MRISDWSSDVCSSDLTAMDKFFGNLHAVLGTGLVLAIILMLCLNGQNFEDGIAAGNAIMRWIHTFFGVLWIGLLYYFNFVQMPTMPDRKSTRLNSSH